jgi:hypothetical protein
MVVRLRNSRVGVPQGTADSAGFVSLAASEQLAVNFGPQRGTKYIETVPTVPVLLAEVGDTQLTVQDSGKTVVFDDTDTVNALLPKASACKGCSFVFFQKQNDAVGDGHTVTPFAGDYIGAGITALEVDADDILLNCIDGDAVGNRFVLRSNGVNGWVITAVRGGQLEKVAP